MTTPTPAPIESAADPKPRQRFDLPLPGLWVWITCVTIALIGSSLSLRGVEFIGLDRLLVQDNTFLNALAGVQRIWFDGVDPATYPLPHYSPLTQTFFFFERMIWGDHVWGYRLTTVLLHATTGLILWQLLRRLAVPGALVVTLLFVAHPICVENVILLSERRNVLAAVLGLSAVFLLLRAADVIPGGTGKRKLLPDEPVRLYAMGIVLFVVGLFASATIATLPLVMLLVAWWRKGRLNQTLAMAGFGLLVAGLAMLAWTSTIEKAHAGAPAETYWNRADNSAGELAVRAQVAGRATWFYAQKLLVPIGLAVDYPRWQTPQDVARFKQFSPDADLTETKAADVAPGNVVAYFWPLLVVTVVVGTYVGRQRAGVAPYVVVASFVLLLLPSLGFIDLGWMRYSFVANHAAYLAAIPLIAGIVTLGDRLLTRHGGDRIAANATVTILLITCVVFSVNASRRASRNEAFFWLTNANLVRDSRSWMPRYALAERMVDVAIALDPAAAPEAAKTIASVRRVRPDEPCVIVLEGKLAARMGDPRAAIARFEESKSRFPSYGPAHFAAAELYRFEANARPTDPRLRGLALLGYQTAAEKDPLDAPAHLRLGETAFEFARRLEPSDPKVQEHMKLAVDSLRKATSLRPYDVDLLVEVSNLYIKMGRPTDTAEPLIVAQRLAPRRADVYMTIAEAALQTGNIAGGEAALLAALEHDDTLVQAYVNLGTLRQAQERWDDAKTYLDKAVELEPTNAEAAKRLKEVESRAATQPAS